MAEGKGSWREKRRGKIFVRGPMGGVFGYSPQAAPRHPRNPPLSKKSGPGKSGSERKAKWPRKQGHKPRTSELFLGRRSGAERGQVPTKGGTGALEDTSTKPLTPVEKVELVKSQEDKRRERCCSIRRQRANRILGGDLYAGLWMDDSAVIALTIARPAGSPKSW